MQGSSPTSYSLCSTFFLRFCLFCVLSRLDAYTAVVFVSVFFFAFVFVQSLFFLAFFLISLSFTSVYKTECATAQRRERGERGERGTFAIPPSQRGTCVAGATLHRSTPPPDHDLYTTPPSRRFPFPFCCCGFDPSSSISRSLRFS